MKVCVYCSTSKSLSEFNRHAGRRDGLQTFCRDCNRARSRAYYAKNREKHKRVVREITKKRIEANHLFVCEYLASHPCTDCGQPDIRCLDFDHLSDKDRSVSELVLAGAGRQRIDTEIAKCEVVCANCHRIRTNERGGHFRQRFLESLENIT